MFLTILSLSEHSDLYISATHTNYSLIQFTLKSERDSFITSFKASDVSFYFIHPNLILFFISSLKAPLFSSTALKYLDLSISLTTLPFIFITFLTQFTPCTLPLRSKSNSICSVLLLLILNL